MDGGEFKTLLYFSPTSLLAYIFFKIWCYSTLKYFLKYPAIASLNLCYCIKVLKLHRRHVFYLILPPTTPNPRSSGQ